MDAARKEIVVIGGVEFRLYEPLGERPDIFHSVAARGGETKPNPGWYAAETGPHPTLAAACEASGVRYPGTVAHNTPGHRTTGDVEQVIRYEMGE